MKSQTPQRARKTKSSRPDALVVLVGRDEKSKKATFESVPEAVRDLVRAAAPPEPGAEGSLFTVALGEDAPAARLYVVGTGGGPELSPRKARGLIRSVVRTLEKNGETSALVDFPLSLARMDAAEAREFLSRTLALALYRFGRYKSKDEPGKLQAVSWSGGRGPWADVEESRALKEIEDAAAVAAVTAFVRDLGNTPPSDMRPRTLAEAVRAEARRRRLPVTVLGKKEIEKERMGGLLAVSRGAVEEPRFVVLEYHGGARGEAPVALVGKGVTFDSGGISIKPADRMGDMKWDMMGAATVLGTVLAAADLGLPVNLVALAPLTENLPSGSAYVPGDVVRFRNGKTAEIDNTDAEGRVILADALDYAKEWKPSVIVDYATLTGAALVAIGLEASALFTRDDALSRALVSAGERTDERLWRLPLWEEYRENLRSDWADFKNTGGRNGGSINGAMFLAEFVDEGQSWAHLDIAPVAYFEREHAGYPAGATGIGIALTLRWLRDRAAQADSAEPAPPRKGRRRPA